MARPKKNPEHIIKLCHTCKLNFTIPYKKKSQLFCSKSCAQRSVDVQAKIKQSQLLTYQQNYGVNHPMKTEGVYNNFKNSMLKKYNVEHALQDIDILTKSKTTKLKKYGDENYNNTVERKKTCLEKYGVDNPRKCVVVNNKIIHTVKNTHYNYLLEYCKTKNIIPLFQFEEYHGYDYKNKYPFKCGTCDKRFHTDVYKQSHIFCEVCNPTDHNTLENELFIFITSLLPSNVVIKRNDRTILVGKELDIYVPEKNIAIELNGLYWHSEVGHNINKQYHLNKYKSCLFHGINLIHVFENEWTYKKDIVKSIIKNKLGYIDKKYHARQCIVKVVGNKEKVEFLEHNHIQGDDKSSIKLGLYHDNELISLMTFGKSRFDKSIQYEMYRYCNKLNTSSIGGASKLFSYFIKNYSPTSVISYNDRRYFDGTVYKQLNFEFVKNTPPNYFYITPDYKKLIGRQTFQKHKQSKLLEIFDCSISEWENMKNNGYDRIWDCGNGKWIFKK